MTREMIPLQALEAAREQLKSDLMAGLQPRHWEFLLGLVRCTPDWSLMQCARLAELPAIRWKLLNLRKFRDQKPENFAEQIRKMEQLLG